MPHRMPVRPALPWPASIQLFCDSVSHPVTLLVASEWAGFGFVIPQHCRAEQLGLLGSQGGGCGSLYPFPLHSWSPGPARSAQQPWRHGSPLAFRVVHGMIGHLLSCVIDTWHCKCLKDILFYESIFLSCCNGDIVNHAFVLTVFLKTSYVTICKIL